MIEVEERHYKSDEGKIIIRTPDGFRMGQDMYLAVNDNIANYTEDSLSEEEILHYQKLKVQEEQMLQSLDVHVSE